MPSTVDASAMAVGPGSLLLAGARLGEGFPDDLLLAIDQLDRVEGLHVVLPALCPHRPLRALPARQAEDFRGPSNPSLSPWKINHRAD